MVKAFGLLSGGLDSILAAKILIDQGIEVVGVSFKTPFFDSIKGEKAAEMLGIKLKVVDITEPHIKMLKNPRYGYGSNLNPCIDCHALMLRSAGKLMEKEGGDFLFTGEVLGQRPMSQTRSGLNAVEKISGYKGKILRPLSALKLKETWMEKEKLVDRTKLYGFTGRSRKPQIELAKKLGILEYPGSAGGCLLTDPRFSERLKDLINHRKDFKPRDLELLKIGRHLRISDNFKLVVGRNKIENEKIMLLIQNDDRWFKVENYPGPIGLVPYGKEMTDLYLAASICVRYSDANSNKEVSVITETIDKEERIKVVACSPKITEDLII
ncbi:MAG: tRNA 4-thiouridine(8) synthase ThiI [Deltaproteobacteria bacterium]|nr:MAG: tRNA 4-thiouridine(8) synthase ThiI [Deltaproteobacteria bacterium]